MPLQQILDAWNAFFHEPISCAPLVLFRLLIGTLLLVNAVLLVPLIDDYYAVDGLWNRDAWLAYQRRSRLCLLHLLPPSTNAFRMLWLIHLIAVVGFVLGWQFRVCSVAVFVTLVSIHHRNGFILSSGDTLLRLFTFLMMFSDANAALAVDAMGSRKAGQAPIVLIGASPVFPAVAVSRQSADVADLRRAARQSDGYGDGFGEPSYGERATRVAFAKIDPWPMRLMQLLICIVYVRTVFWKLRGKMWWNGTAAWYPLWVDAYVRFRPPTWLLGRWSIRLATWGTLVSELALATLIWVKELRYPVLACGVVLHMMLDVVMNLQFFSWIMICGLTLFVFPEDSERVLVWIARA